MRWIVVLFLWAAAIVLALLILRRVRRGKPVVLTGRWSPRVVRMVVVVLVVLGVGEEARPPGAEAAPPRLPIRPAADRLPATVNANTVRSWLAEHEENGPFAPGKRELVRLLAGQKLEADQRKVATTHTSRLAPTLRALVQADLTGPESRPTAADLIAVVNDLEKRGQFDHYWTGYLWRKASLDAAGGEARIALFARLRQHARITDALIRAHAQVKPLMQPPRAWMSKAAGRPQDNPAIHAYHASLHDMVAAANELLPSTDEGTWKRDGIALLKRVAGEPLLVRGDRQSSLSTDEFIRFGRLDLLKTGEKPATIAHEWLGNIEVPANRLVSVWDLPALLPDAAKQKLDETVHEALKSNAEEASDRLERCLAISHHAVRAGLRELPNARGAPRLRLILSLFDDTTMPPLTNHRGGRNTNNE